MSVFGAEYVSGLIMSEIEKVKVTNSLHKKSELLGKRKENGNPYTMNESVLRAWNVSVC